MRKLHYMLILTMAAVISGCTEKKDMEFAPVDNSGYTLIEADLQTLLGSEQRLWPADASIGVYGSEKGENERYTIKNAGVGLKNASFYGPLVKGDIVAYYPYSSSYQGKIDAMPVALESEQVYGADPIAHFIKYTPMAFGYMQGGKLDFVYPNGLLHVTVETFDALTVKKVTVSSQSAKLAGTGVLQNGGVLNLTGASTNLVSLDCGEGVMSRNGEKYADFYIVLLPGMYDDLALTVEIESEEPLTRVLPQFEVKRMSAEDMSITSVIIKPSSGPDDFTDNEVEFE